MCRRTILELEYADLFFCLLMKRRVSLVVSQQTEIVGRVTFFVWLLVLWQYNYEILLSIYKNGENKHNNFIRFISILC